MFSSNSVRCDLLRARLGSLLAVTFTILCLALATNGQTTTTSVTDGRTPSGLQAGSPLGNYPLSGFDNVNLYNGNLNFRLPLLQVGGRGSAQMRMMLALNLKSWRIKTTHKEMPDGNTIHSYVPTQTGWLPFSGYGAGRLDGRNYGLHTSSNLSCRWYSTTLSRLTFSAADGTEYELRDQLTNGQPLSSTCTQGAQRGTVFITADGSAATFISDTAISDNPTINTSGPHNFSVSGVLKLRDGSQYRIDNSNVTWIRDHNGNRITFTYSTNSMTITDSLNRQVTVNYDVSDVAPYGLCDQIIYKGFGGAQRILRVSHTNLGNALRPNSGYVLRTFGGSMGLFPESTGSSSTYHDPTVTSAVWLPDGRGYKFFYNSYGELARVELPTGGAYEYDMTPGSGVICPGSCTLEDGREIYRRVVERRVYSNGGTGSTFDHRQVYTNTEALGSSTATVSVEQLSPTGTVLTRSRHFFASSALDSLFVGDEAQAYGAWYEGNETQTEILATTGAIGAATLLQRTATTRAQRAPVSWWASYVVSHPNLINKEPLNDSRVTEVVNTLEPATSNLVSKQAFGYDDSVPFNNQNNVKEYGFGTGSPGSLVRETRTTYLTSSTYTGTNVHVRTLPIQVSIYDGGGTERARSTIEYDNHNNDSSHAALVDRSSISGFDAAFTTAYTTRGNPTGSTSYLLVNGSVTGSISAYSQFDIAGNVVKTIDARGNATSIFYTDCFGTPNGEAQTSIDPLELGSITKTFAFPTEIRNSLNQSVFAQFDYYLGQPVDAKDINGVVASGYFVDSLDRPTTIRRAVGTSLENRTILAYDDTNRIITTTNDRDMKDDGILVSKLIYDQMGRTIEVRQYEGGTNYVASQTQYDALGRAFKTSNPFRPWQSESAVWTTQTFDDLGRVVSVTTPDSAVLTSSYSGNTVTVTDQTGKQRKSVTDALGRLIQVYEAPNDASFNYLTTYAYDALDNLTTVTQGSQTRTFVYDSLKRLTSATNPESGTITYQYDANGNLIVRTDPRIDPVDSTRTVNSHFGYDALNRVTRRWYNGSNSVSANTHNSPALPSGVGGTNEAKFYYDSQSLPTGAPSYSRGAAVGRLVAQTYGSGSNGDYYAYDELGRATLKIQQTGLLNFQSSAAYNLAGASTSYVYPSGHTISNSYDAAGRLITFSGNLGDGTTRTYANEITYSSFGPLAREKFGTSTPIYHKLLYNSRGQLFDTRVSSVNDTWDWNRGRLILYYSSNHLWGQSGSDNNGNVLFAETWIPPENATLDQADTVTEQSYTYDPLSRLTSVAEQRMTAAGGWVWSQQFQQSYNYDRWGNRTINPASWGTGINVKQFTVNTANNRLGVPVGQTGTMSYDTAGNLTNDTYTGAGNRTYDAENKITSAWGGNNQAQLYGYDASGQRIKRTVNGVETWQVYGLGGELLAEYAATGSPGSPQKEYGYRNGQLLITASLAGSDHSLSTNGTSAYVQGPSSSSLSITGAITVEAWIKIDSIGAYRTIISKEAFQQTGTGGGYRLAITDLGKVRLDLFQTHNTYTTAIGTATVTAGVWQHVAGVFDGSQMRIYLNGVLNGTVSTTAAPAAGTGNFYLGRFSYSLNPYYFNGLIDEARVSNAALYTSNFTPANSLTASGSTKGLWKFNGQTTNDSSGNNNNGTLQGGAGYSGNVPGGGGGNLQLQWLVTDHLGTPRMILDQTGSLANMKRHDYLPFGEELIAPIGGRTTAQGYAGGDGVRQQFTSNERDVETGLDYFMARYYMSVHGRFTAVDPLMASANPGIPQSWNRYSYCINNPLIFVDPEGLVWGYRRDNETGITSYQWFEGDEVGEGFTKVTEFYVEGEIDGRQVSLTLNPDGPRSFWKSVGIHLFSLAPFLASTDDYFEKGFRIGPTHQQVRDASRFGGIDMMPNQAFDVGLLVGGFRVPAPRIAPSGVSLEGSAYELTFLNKHLPGTAEAAREIAKTGSAHVFNDLSTLSRVESEIFARGIETTGARNWSRFGVRFDEPIGTRIGKDGTTTALHYGEMKMRSNGLYHVVPRTGPAK